mmetsp:Transcript_11303/g.16898  ORF Transcript_11303/g.16898 Transcript_11303/m.16898 type:complete len:136 (+) Transcript_11303:46-453(+)
MRHRVTQASVLSSRSQDSTSSISMGHSVTSTAQTSRTMDSRPWSAISSSTSNRLSHSNETSLEDPLLLPSEKLSVNVPLPKDEDEWQGFESLKRSIQIHAMMKRQNMDLVSKIKGPGWLLSPKEGGQPAITGKTS